MKRLSLKKKESNDDIPIYDTDLSRILCHLYVRRAFREESEKLIQQGDQLDGLSLLFSHAFFRLASTRSSPAYFQSGSGSKRSS